MDFFVSLIKYNFFLCFLTFACSSRVAGELGGVEVAQTEVNVAPWKSDLGKCIDHYLLKQWLYYALQHCQLSIISPHFPEWKREWINYKRLKAESIIMGSGGRKKRGCEEIEIGSKLKPHLLYSSKAHRSGSGNSSEWSKLSGNFSNGENILQLCEGYFAWFKSSLSFSACRVKRRKIQIFSFISR